MTKINRESKVKDERFFWKKFLQSSKICRYLLVTMISLRYYR